MKKDAGNTSSATVTDLAQARREKSRTYQGRPRLGGIGYPLRFHDCRIIPFPLRESPATAKK